MREDGRKTHLRCRKQLTKMTSFMGAKAASWNRRIGRVWPPVMTHKPGVYLQSSSPFYSYLYMYICKYDLGLDLAVSLRPRLQRLFGTRELHIYGFYRNFTAKLVQISQIWGRFSCFKLFGMSSCTVY
jgi:hypothetical protein